MAWHGMVRYNILCYAMQHVRYAMLLVFIPNRTLLLRFRSVSGEFGRAMVFFWRDVVAASQNTHGETTRA